MKRYNFLHLFILSALLLWLGSFFSLSRLAGFHGEDYHSFSWAGSVDPFRGPLWAYMSFSGRLGANFIHLLQMHLGRIGGMDDVGIIRLWSLLSVIGISGFSYWLISLSVTEKLDRIFLLAPCLVIYFLFLPSPDDFIFHMSAGAGFLWPTLMFLLFLSIAFKGLKTSGLAYVLLAISCLSNEVIAVMAVVVFALRLYWQRRGGQELALSAVFGLVHLASPGNWKKLSLYQLSSDGLYVFPSRLWALLYTVAFFLGLAFLLTRYGEYLVRAKTLIAGIALMLMVGNPRTMFVVNDHLIGREWLAKTSERQQMIRLAASKGHSEVRVPSLNRVPHLVRGGRDLLGGRDGHADPFAIEVMKKYFGIRVELSKK